MDDIQQTQRSFALKALNHKGHRFDDLYHLICRHDWIEQALKAVLDNQGSRTPGVDGITRKSLTKQDEREQFITQLQADLKAGMFKTSPVERVYIPKANGKQRPLGIPTLRDRTVQMLLKMLFEPIWESDFYDFSNGFRPGRRTMDCIAPMFRHVHDRHHYYWVIEGDIKGCFDHINHVILMRELKRRIADKRILNLVYQFLKAGVMEGELFHKTSEGTPQGGIVSPLLANIYLHRFDEWWWEHFGGLTIYEKKSRRQKHQGNGILVRYADDFVILWNGDKAGAEQLREQVKQFLANELHLELSLEKTHITHVLDGFDFLGFHIKRYEDPNDRPTLRVEPSKKNIERFKNKILAMTAHKRGFDNPLDKFIALNAMMRGWIGYFRHVSAKGIARELDWWVNHRVVLWMMHKHKTPIREILKQYKSRERKGKLNRDNLAVKNKKGDNLYLYKMSDMPIRPYQYPFHRTNPYLEGEGIETAWSEMEIPLPDDTWNGWSENNLWHDICAAVLARDGYRCQECGSQENLDVHHKQARKDGGSDEFENLVTLCERCHTQTDTYGRNRT